MSKIEITQSPEPTFEETVWMISDVIYHEQDAEMADRLSKDVIRMYNEKGPAGVESYTFDQWVDAFARESFDALIRGGTREMRTTLFGLLYTFARIWPEHLEREKTKK